MMTTQKKISKTPARPRCGLLTAFSHDESGATAIEYGMIASLIIIAIIAALNTFSDNTSGMYTSIATTLDGG